MESITERIEIGDGDITIELYKPPPPTKPRLATENSSGNRGKRATKLHPCVALLPWGAVTRKCPKPGPFPEGPQTLGEHLKEKRLRDGLQLTEAAQTLGVNPFTLSNWERGKTTPTVSLYGRVVEHLGFDPDAGSGTLTDRMISYRRSHGLSQRAAARALGVDPTTWWRWETRRSGPKGRLGVRLLALLESSHGCRAARLGPRSSR